MKSKQLNTALDTHLNNADVVITVDDDIVRCLQASTRIEVPLQQVAQTIAQELCSSKALLGGPYSGTNTSWAPKEIRSHGLIPGAMMCHRRGTTIRFDTLLPSMEDLDFCIQHHIQTGEILLHGDYCLENLWEGNGGGYQTCRTEQSKRQTVEILREKWNRYGCLFETDVSKKNKIRFRIPWKKLTKKGGFLPPQNSAPD